MRWGAQLASWKVHDTTTLTKGQARRHWIISRNIKYERLRRMAVECLVMYDLSASERILVQILRATFE